jgi:hypothetical protein
VLRLAIAPFRFYALTIDIWPDNWAASPPRLQARTFQILQDRRTGTMGAGPRAPTSMRAAGERRIPMTIANPLTRFAAASDGSR